MKLKLYSFIYLLNSFISGLFIPILSLMLIDKGASLSSLSIIMGVFSFTVIVFELPTGIMSDVMGRKKTFCISILVSIISSIFFLFGYGFFVLSIGVALYGLKRALSSGSFDALFIDSYIDTYGKENLHNITTRLSVLDALGLSTGALIGGLLPEITSKWFLSLGLYDLILIFSISLSIVLVIISMIVVTDKKAKEKVKQISIKKHILNSSTFVMNNKTVMYIFISIFSTGFFLSALETYWQPHFKSLLPDNSLMVLFGVMSFLYFFAAMFGSIVANKIINKYSKFNTRKMYLIFRLLLSIVIIFTALQIKVQLFMLFYTILYLIFGMANIPEAVILNGEIPSEIRASILSVNSLILQFGVIIGSVINSFVINYISIPKLWIIAAIVVFITVLIIYRELVSNHNNSYLDYK